MVLQAGTISAECGGTVNCCGQERLNFGQSTGRVGRICDGSQVCAQVNVGDKAPNFKVVNDSFAPVELATYSKKTLLISVVPSLDTGVCSIQTKRFNEEVANLPDDIVMLTISNDLPFAQKRFCKAENIDKVKVLSDAVWRDFGQKYGLLIKDMGLLTRAIFIIEPNGTIAYKELVENISNHPDYDMALSTLKALSTPVSQEQEPAIPATLPETTGE